MRIWRMRTGISIKVTRSDRRRLKALAKDRNAPQKHVWRAEIVLFTAEGLGTNEIMRRTGKAKTSIWRWQERFMEEGFDGLLRDKTRPSRIPPLGVKVTERVVELTLTKPPGDATHWTGTMMAKASGISVSAVQRIWRAHGLRPHKVEQFKLSTDPRFIDKLRDVVGLYVNPPAHAIVLSVDEKSQIQSLDRTQPGLPMKKGRAGTMTHDYKRNGTTTLFAALDVLEGKVIGRCMQRHRHQEFIRFLNAIEAEVPAGKLVHVILDNYAAPKHPKVRAWLDVKSRPTATPVSLPITTPLRRRVWAYPRSAKEGPAAGAARVMGAGGGGRGRCLCTHEGKPGWGSGGGFSQLRFLNRQLVLPVSTISQ
jgi:transposase